MKNLRECIAEARQKKVAIGHFNVSDSNQVWAIFKAAQSLNVPVIIGVSEGERDFIGVKQAVALIKSFDYPIFINADHTYSFEKVKEAVDAGFDSVIFDGAQLSFEENVKIARQCVEYASGRAIVEGELGFIGKGSEIHDEIPANLSALTDPEEAKRFVEQTGVDMLAPALGNFHGMVKGNTEAKKLNPERVKEISEITKVPIVLHGGSGDSEEMLKEVIANGVTIVHINTEIRVAYKQGIMQGISENPEEVAPYKFLKPAVQAVQE